MVIESNLKAEIKGIGIDIATVSRVAGLVSRYDRESIGLLFTTNEISWCQSAPHSDRYYAVCFSTKEAVGKALGTGLVDLNWNEIEARVRDTSLQINLYGLARQQAVKCGISRWLATWCYWDDYVLVHVLAQ